MWTRLMSRKDLSTKEKSLQAATLMYSCSQIELSSEITKNSQGTIHDKATFLKLPLAMKDPFEHLPNLQKGNEY